MNFRVLKPFKGRTEDGERMIEHGMVVNLPYDEAIRLLNKGMIEPAERMALKVYSEVLGVYLWVAFDRAEMDRLRAQGVTEAIYTAQDIRLLRGASRERLRAVHEVKHLFPLATAEEIKGKEGKG